MECFVNMVGGGWGVIVWCLSVVLLIWWGGGGVLCGVFFEVGEALNGFLKGEGRLYCVFFFVSLVTRLNASTPP